MTGRRSATVDLEAERVLLGSLPISPRGIPVAMRNLDPSDFYDPRHATIYARMIDLYAGSGVLEFNALVHELERHGELSGGLDRRFVLTLVSEGAPVNHEHYAARILDAATRRRLVALAAEVTDRAQAVEVDTAETLDRTRAALAEITLPVLDTDPSPDLETFCADDADPAWLIPGLIEHEDRIMVTAGEGVGKSMLLRQVAVMAAAGIHPFTWVLTRPVRTLIIDLESSEALVRRKLRPLLARAREVTGGRFDPGNVRVEVRSAGIDLTKRADQSWFVSRLASARPDLVALGPLYKCYVGDNNEEQVARRVADVLDEARSRFGCAFLIETHAPHGEGRNRTFRPVGSSLWLRWPEIGLGLVQGNRSWELTRWRRPRDERAWPTELQHGQRWPWESV